MGWNYCHRCFAFSLQDPRYAHVSSALQWAGCENGKIATSLSYDIMSFERELRIAPYMCHAVNHNVPSPVLSGNVVLSIPYLIHLSHTDVLKKYCNEPSRKLELFARNLLPDWTSWGNEVKVRKC